MSSTNSNPSSEAGLANLRTCLACAREVDRKDCHRNRHGKYICHECQDKARAREPSEGVFFSPGTTSLKTCAACSRNVESSDCHRNRYGEYICLECKGKGLKFSEQGKALRTRRRIKYWASRVAWVLFGMLVLASYYSVTRGTVEEVPIEETEP